MSGYLVGLTGGIASGKSEVGRRFQALGVSVLDADAAAREAVAVGSAGLGEIVASFGKDALAPDGMLDRAGMRRRVFADEGARRRLEAIVHPRVRALLRVQADAAPGAYAIVAIPLLAESGGRAAYPWLDRILIIESPLELQVERLLQRDAVDVELAHRMIAAQATRETRLAIADDVLVNDRHLHDLDARVAELDRQYRALAAPSKRPS